jgi:hypothetical protein
MKSGVSKAMYREYPAYLWLTPTVAARDQAALAMAADFHTISRITQIWSDRLQLISVYVRSHAPVSLTPEPLKSTRIHAGQFLHVNRQCAILPGFQPGYSQYHEQADACIVGRGLDISRGDW